MMFRVGLGTISANIIKYLQYVYIKEIEKNLILHEIKIIIICENVQFSFDLKYQKKKVETANN
jgi:hypothetical protein